MAGLGQEQLPVQLEISCSAKLRGRAATYTFLHRLPTCSLIIINLIIQLEEKAAIPPKTYFFSFQNFVNPRKQHVVQQLTAGVALSPVSPFIRWYPADCRGHGEWCQVTSLTLFQGAKAQPFLRHPQMSHSLCHLLKKSNSSSSLCPSPPIQHGNELP